MSMYRWQYQQFPVLCLMKDPDGQKVLKIGPASLSSREEEAFLKQQVVRYL